MAQKLHSQYGYGYDNLKVLLGGWNTWNQEHAKDPNAYPVDTAPGGDTSGGNPPAPQATIAPATPKP